MNSNLGATNNTFGSKGVQEYCHFLKEIEDAEKIQDCIVERFETASLPSFLSDERYVVTIACELGFRF
jgi:NADH:ubiquinone reductase (non-electrogenic)